MWHHLMRLDAFLLFIFRLVDENFFLLLVPVGGDFRKAIHIFSSDLRTKLTLSLQFSTDQLSEKRGASVSAPR
jgi:hypothetical protein